MKRMTIRKLALGASLAVLVSATHAQAQDAEPLLLDSRPAAVMNDMPLGIEDTTPTQNIGQALSLRDAVAIGVNTNFRSDINGLNSNFFRTFFPFI